MAVPSPSSAQAPSTFRILLKPSGHEFRNDGSVTLLQAALDAGYSLPYGCRDGACGSCKGKVLEGLVDHGQAQSSVLSQSDRNLGYALFCCAKPITDVILECREADVAKDIPIKLLPCRVQKIERLADDVIVLSLTLPGSERLQFLAGQYIEFLLKDGKRRAFSIANAPSSDDLLQVHVQLIDDGQFTGHVFHHLKEKDILRFQGPYGSFCLRDDSSKPTIFLAGGTGFAPIKSLVETMLHRQIVRPTTIYWGARDKAGLYLDALPAHWSATYPHISYHPVLSESNFNDVWTGRTGLVHQAVLDDHPNLSGFQVYACGAPAMIEAARSAFIARGLANEDFIFDSFTFASNN